MEWPSIANLLHPSVSVIQYTSPTRSMKLYMSPIP